MITSFNESVCRIWDRLGFQKVGRIPRAGRLRRRAEDREAEAGAETAGDEEYVDAWVIYKDFENQEGGDVMAS